MNLIKEDKRFHKWRAFEEAREYVRSLGLKNSDEWHAWARSGARPDDIPHNAREVYKVAEDSCLRHGAGQPDAASAQGWISLGDWLGTGHIAYQKMVYRPFSEARAYVRSLGLKNYYEWKAWVKSPERPDDIPAGAHRTYKDKGWAGWGNWLGTGRKYRKRYARRSLEEAREYVHSLGLKRYSDWRKWCKSGSRPNDIPSRPESYYKGKGWVSWGDWLGTGRISSRKRVHLPYAEAREFVRKLGLNSIKEWQEWARSDKRLENIPMNPRGVYGGKGWIGYGDWLGNEKEGRGR